MTKQAAHEKLRARIQGKLDKKLSKLDQAEQAGHAKIARRAKRGRRSSERQGRQHDKLSRGVQQAREELARAEQTVNDALDKHG